MAPPQQKLADSLAQLRELQRDGRRVFQSRELSRTHRERLLRNGFLQEFLRGWLISTSPSVREGESTPWYATFWEFCAQYSTTRFGTDWCLSPEQSLLLHAETTPIPAQVVIYSPGANNHNLALPFGTSLYDLKTPSLPPAADLMLRDGLRLFTIAAAFTRVPDSFFERHPVETRVLLASLRDPSELLQRLLDGGHSRIAGRLAGALRAIGRTEAAAEILAAMNAAGHDVRETGAFAGLGPAATSPAPPIVGRLHELWRSLRAGVLSAFPPAPGLPRDPAAFLRSIDDLYRTDAYHSLSIEGYQVTGALIERVRAGGWDPEQHEADRQSRDALAARGYWQAFQLVRAGIARILDKQAPGELARAAHGAWYRELFQPCVAAGLVPARALAGYRNEPVYLRASRYVPPRWEAVRDAMPALFDLLRDEPEPAVRAVLGHWLFGFIHPYPDGNGRMARFLMNAMLASGGYPWIVVRVEHRDQYLSALDSASLDSNIAPFAAFLAARVRDASNPPLPPLPPRG
jgi:fido (protein-threonine AMPylation protein)